MEQVLDLLDADDVYLGLRQSLREEVQDPTVGLRPQRNVYQAVLLL